MSATRWSKVGGIFAFVVCDFCHFEVCHFCSEVFLVVRVVFGYAAFFKFFSDGFCASPCTEDFGGEFRHFLGEETADVFGVDAFEEVFFACFAEVLDVFDDFRWRLDTL